MLALRQSVATFGHGTVYKLCFIGIIYLDLVLTLFAMERGFTEVNPYMVRLLASPESLLLVKVMAPILIAWLVPGRLLLPSIGLMVAVSAWNVGELMPLFS
jgi:hypothetical protein